MDITARIPQFALRLLPWLLPALLAALLLRLSAPPAQANSFVIPDGDVAALIQAIMAANASSGPDTIDLASGGSYTLTTANTNYNGATGLPPLQGQITINGHGATIARSTAGNPPAFRILAIAPNGNIQLNDLTIASGRITSAGSFGVGGGIINDGTLTLNTTTIRDNAVLAGAGISGRPNGDDALGGGIANYGALVLNSSAVRNNTASAGNAFGTGAGGTGFGGGIYSSGSVELHNSTASDNNVAGGTGAGGDGGQAVGGGLYTYQSTMLIDSSTVSGNNASGGASTSGNAGAGTGGGIHSNGGLTLQNSTVSGNSVSGNISFGGGIFNEAGNTTISSSTIGENQANGSLGKGGGYNQNPGTTLTFKNSIIARNTAASGPDCYKIGSFTSQGYNLVEDNSDCFFTSTAGDQIGVDPKLGPLQNNGGATLTRALLAGSPAIDRGNPGGCKDAQSTLLTTDQRGPGFSRSRDGDGDSTARCDIGAYELQSSATSTATPTTTSTPTRTPTATVGPSPTATPKSRKYPAYLPLVVR